MFCYFLLTSVFTSFFFYDVLCVNCSLLVPKESTRGEKSEIFFDGEYTWQFSLLSSYAAIHQEAPEFADMSVQQEILETGIKVVDLLAPYAKGGKIGIYFSIHMFIYAVVIV